MSMPGYRITKYDPKKRNRMGHFVGNDWISVHDIGGVFDSGTLKRPAIQVISRGLPAFPMEHVAKPVAAGGSRPAALSHVPSAVRDA
jgi:hypothetical protein